MRKVRVNKNTGPDRFRSSRQRGAHQNVGTRRRTHLRQSRHNPSHSRNISTTSHQPSRRPHHQRHSTICVSSQESGVVRQQHQNRQTKRKKMDPADSVEKTQNTSEKIVQRGGKNIGNAERRTTSTMFASHQRKKWAPYSKKKISPSQWLSK